MADMYLGSQCPMYQNVHIKVFNSKTGAVRIERDAKNRVTKLMLWGIAQFLAGNFNDSNPDKQYEFWPRYLALGDNKPGADADTAGVTTGVTVLDSRLLNEYKMINTDGSSESVKRINIQGRQHSKINTNFNDPYVKLTLSAYVNSEKFDGLEIGEAGLFSKEYDNNCLARVVFPPFVKQPGEVIDIQWEITLLSYGTTKYPENIQIENGGKVIVPITYSNYNIVTYQTGLYYANDTLILNDEEDTIVFLVDPDTGYVKNNYIDDDETKEEFIQRLSQTSWNIYLEEIGLSVEYIVNKFETYRLDVWQFRYKESNLPGVFYLGDIQRIQADENYLLDNASYYLHDSDDYQLVTSDPLTGYMNTQPVLMSFIYDLYTNQTKVETTGKLTDTDDPDDYIVEFSNNGVLDTTTYKVIDNEFYKLDEDSTTSYSSMNTFMNNGIIINEDGTPTGYIYESDGRIYKIEEDESVNNKTNAYLAYEMNTQGKEYVFRIYRESDLNITIDTGYWIDWLTDKEVYSGTTDTLYHITNDNFFAIGETYPLSVYITPTDATDKSVSWSIINSNISKINDQGVLHAWNVGQTMAIVTTSNNIRARVEVEVVKNAQIIPVEALSIDPSEITFYVDESYVDRVVTVTAKVVPSFSTYRTVKWTTDAAFDALCALNPIGNNQAEVRLNKLGNVGRGRLTATTLDGKSASCLINVIYKSDDSEDCPDPFHNDQQA